MAQSQFPRREPRQTSTGRRARSVLATAVRFVRGLFALIVLLALIVGLPWALVHFVGWPLPGHVLTWDEVQATLLNPMSAQFLLDTLAVLCWIVWFFFALDVARCTVDGARGITWRQVRPPGPLQGLAAALIGTVVLTLLGSRTSYTAPNPRAAALTDGLAPVAVVAPLTPGPIAPPPAQPAPDVRLASTLVIDRSAPSPPGTVQVTEGVQLPHDGIYDSLWRMAERIYGPGGGNRWPDLFKLNRGVEQPDGRSLTNPNLIRPGWKITAYVTALPDERPTSEQPPQVPSPHPQRPTSTAPSTPSTTQPAPNTTEPANDHSHDTNDQSGSGTDLLPGIFVSFGLAAAITAAVVSARMWQRRRYRMGSGDRTDLSRPIAPIVRALRIAHDHKSGDEQSGEDVEFLDLAPASPQIHIRATGIPEPEDNAVPVPARVGVRGGRDLALNLASTRGLGLAGPGAVAAARALLLHLLTEQQHGSGICVLAPIHDLHLILDGADVEHLPSTVHVVASLDTALDEVESALLTRTRQVIEATELQTTSSPLVLLATAEPHTERRLQAVLDNGSALGLAGVLLGQWRPGATVLVRHDGTVSATSPDLGNTLSGTRLFNLPATDTTELLAVLHDAEGPAEPAAGEQTDLVGQQQIPLADRGQNAAQPAAPVPDQREAGEETRLESTSPCTLDSAEPAAKLQLLETQANDVALTFVEADHINEHLEVTTDVERTEDRPPQREQPPTYVSADQCTTGRPLRMHVLGRLVLHLHDDTGEHELNGALTAKQRELLVYLALHPQGVRREVLNEAVWPDSQPPRPYNSFHNTLSMLRRALSDATDGLISNAILNDDGRYQLDSTLVTVDYWRLQHALQEPRPGDIDAQERLYDVVELYRGDLAEDLLVTWIEPLREATRRDVLDALSTLIRAHGDTDQKATLTLLERTRKLDRYNEGVYRDIIRTQARLGQYAGIPRTVALLTTTLDEIDQNPSADTLNLADFLQRCGGARPTTS